MTITAHWPRLAALVGLIAGCGSSSSTGTTSTGGSISLSLDPPAASVPQGQTISVTGTVLRKDGFTGDVGIAVLDAPAGVVPALIQRPVNGSGTAVVTLAVDSQAVIGIDTLTFQAGASGISIVTQPFVLTVTAATPEDSFTVSASGLNLMQGGSNSALVTFNRSNFTGPVTLSAEGLPVGVTAAFNPNPVTANTSTVTFTVAADAPFASDSTFIRATAPGLRDITVPIVLTVIPAGN